MTNTCRLSLDFCPRPELRPRSELLDLGFSVCLEELSAWSLLPHGVAEGKWRYTRIRSLSSCCHLACHCWNERTHTVCLCCNGLFCGRCIQEDAPIPVRNLKQSDSSVAPEELVPLCSPSRALDFRLGENGGLLCLLFPPLTILVQSLWRPTDCMLSVLLILAFDQE